jgi:hypothetical protein
MLTLLNRFSKYSIVIFGFLAITLSHAQDDRDENISILDVDANGEVDALTDGLLILRSMFELTDDALVTGVVDSVNCKECDAEGIDQYISNIKESTHGKLSSYDDQNISGSSLSGTTLTIGIENGASETVDLSSLEDGTGITSTQATAITDNTAKVGITSGQASAITDNTAKTGITSAQASAITDNTAKTGIISSQASAIIANTAKVGGITHLVEYDSLYIGNEPSNTTDSARYNLAIGTTALEAITTGETNVAVGHDALAKNTIGSYNTAIGYKALADSTGGQNVAVGYGALQSNSLGKFNTAIGLNTLANNKGNHNAALGRQALLRNTSGSYNTASGNKALLNNTTGSYNTAYGYGALYTNTYSDHNTAIGYGADIASDDLNNATAIGNGAIVNASDKIRLGNTSVTVIEGQVAFTTSSDRRLKKDIVDTRYGLNTILELRPVDYQMKSNNLEQIGFIAQELRPIVPEAVSGIEGDLEKDETLGVAYTTLIPVLTKAIQEQQVLIKGQNKVNQEQQMLIEAQNKVIQQLQKDVLMLKQK